MAIEKIVLVTRRTRLQELIERFNSKSQAKFYIEHSGGDFSDYEKEDEQYKLSIDNINRELDIGIKFQIIERNYLPTFMFTEKDLIVAMGQDGLVANIAKYIGECPLIAVNPDSRRFDGILLPFQVSETRNAVLKTIEGKAVVKRITMGEATLNDGQRLLAFNDFFIGARTHISARYSINYGKNREAQSSSGVIVSTGVGSSGWLSSLFNMASGIAKFTNETFDKKIQLPWDTSQLIFVVREPFISKYSGAQIVSGMVDENTPLIMESLMSSEGVIFSDGIESDYIQFNAGSLIKIVPAKQATNFIIK